MKENHDNSKKEHNDKMHNLFVKYGVMQLKLVEHAVLIIIAIATIIAIGQELYTMFLHRNVALEDLLLLFIYLEVLAMVSNYAESGKLPIRMPIYIAIVALARYLILDVKNMGAWQILAISTSALILSGTVIVIKWGQHHFRSKNELGE